MKYSNFSSLYKPMYVVLYLDCKTVRIFCVFRYAQAVKQKVWNQADFFLSPHTPLRACETSAFRAFKTFMPRFTDFLTDFKKKTDCFAVYFIFYMFSSMLDHLVSDTSISFELSFFMIRCSISLPFGRRTAIDE